MNEPKLCMTTQPLPGGLLPCPFCGDDGEKGRQEVTQMNAERTTFTRVICHACGAMCPLHNWNLRYTPEKPELEILHRLKYHYVPEDELRPESFDLYEMNTDYKGCIDVLIVRANHD